MNNVNIFFIFYTSLLSYLQSVKKILDNKQIYVILLLLI